MKKKKQLFMALGALIILLAAYGLFTLSEKKKEAEADEVSSYEAPESWELTRLDETEIRSLSLENTKGSFTLVKKDESWKIRGREELKLNAQAVASLVMSSARIVSFEQISPDSINVEEYGLVEPDAILTIEKPDDTLIRIRIGSANPSGKGHYVQKEGDPAIYLISSFISGPMMNDINSLRDRSLPTINGQDLSYLKIEADRTIEVVPAFQFEKFGSNMSPFLLVRPYRRPLPVNAEKISEYMEKFFSGLIIQTFEDPDTPESVSGLGSAARTIQMKDKSGAEFELRVGNRNDNGAYYCALPGDPGVFTVDGEALSLVEARPFDMADRFVRLVGIDLVETLSVETPEKKWEGRIEKLDEENANYYFQGEMIAEDPFKDMYQEVLYLLYEGELTSDFTSGEAAVTIRYRGNSDNPGETKAEFFPYDRDYYAVSVDGYDVEFLIGKYQVDNLLEFLENFTGKEE